MVIEFDREKELREQREDFERRRYDGHNRHSGMVTMSDLGMRRSRRVWHLRMSQIVKDWREAS